MGQGGNGYNAVSAVGSIGSAATSIGYGYASSAALEAQGNFQKQQFEFNSKMAELQAEDAIKRGYVNSAEYKKNGKALVGAQRASYAAQGVDIGTGSARDVQRETRKQVELDVMTIKNNAWQEAWGYKLQSLDLTGRGQFASLGAKFESQNSILAGYANASKYGFQAVSSGYKYYQGGK